MSEWEMERIRSLRQEARAARASDAWGAADNLDRIADNIEERLKVYDETFAELIDMSADRARAGELATRLGNYTKLQQIERLGGALRAEELITASQHEMIKRRLSTPTPGEKALQDEIEAERIRLEAMIARVLAAVKEKDRARQVYNEVGGPRNDEKIKKWISKLCELDMLPRDTAAVLRFSNWIEKLSLPGENKLARPKENK